MVKHQERCMRGALTKTIAPATIFRQRASRARAGVDSVNRPAPMAALGHSGVKLRHLQPSTFMKA